MKGSRDIGALLKDLVFLYIGFYMFREVMEVVLMTPQLAEQVMVNENILELSKLDFGDGVFAKVIGFSTSDKIKILSSWLYWCVKTTYLAFMGVMIGLGAYVIFFSSILGVRWAIRAYAGFIAVISLWPFIWYSVDQGLVFAVRNLSEKGSSTGILVTFIAAGAIKALAPLAGIITAMKIPVGMGQRTVETLKEGSKPILGTASGAALLTKKIATSTGFDGVKGMGKKKVDALTSGEEQDRSFALKNIGRRSLYGVSRASAKAKSLVGKKNPEPAESFQEFDTRLDRNIHQSRVMDIEKRLNARKTISPEEKQKFLVKRERSLESLSSLKAAPSRKIQVDSMMRSQHDEKIENFEKFINSQPKHSAFRDERFVKSVISLEKSSGSSSKKWKFNKKRNDPIPDTKSIHSESPKENQK